MSYLTRKQTDREIEAMMENCISNGKNAYLFPKYGNLSIKLSGKKTIREWVTSYIESKNNIPMIEKNLAKN